LNGTVDGIRIELEEERGRVNADIETLRLLIESLKADVEATAQREAIKQAKAME
jgi:hypothetical protein